MTNPNPSKDRLGELDEILEGLYRWAINVADPTIKGTGKAPVLKPSEAKSAILKWHSAAVAESKIKELESLSRIYDTPSVPASVKLDIKNRIEQLNKEQR